MAGALSGVFWTMATPVAAEVVGLQDLASALSLLWLLGTVLPTTCFSSLKGSADLVVAEVIALQLTVNAREAGRTGADIYRPTILFSGSMILGGGLILIVHLPSAPSANSLKYAKVWLQKQRHGKSGMYRIMEKT